MPRESRVRGAPQREGVNLRSTLSRHDCNAASTAAAPGEEQRVKAIVSLMAGTALALSLLARPAQAGTIRFETIAPEGGLRNVNPNRPLHTDGTMITDSNGESAVFSATSGNALIGDPSAMFGFAGSDTITLAKTDGSLFDLVRLLLGPSNFGSGMTDITLTGYGLASTDIVTVTFTGLTTATLETLHWDDLTRLTFTATTDSAFDDVVIRPAARPATLFTTLTAVPEPASWGIFAAGLLGLGARRRRTRN